MLAFIEGHPNADLVTLYIIAAIMLGVLLYRFYQRKA